MTDLYTKTGKPFKSKFSALGAIRLKKLEGYEAVETPDGWIGREVTPVVTKSGLDVKCPGCRQSYFETTDKYNPDDYANPSMLKLKEKYVSWGWEDVPQDATAGYGCLECPDCGYPLAPEGKILV